ncbi:hypothetical protein ACFX2J_038779 [Malus domestica]
MQGPCLCLSKVYQSLSRTNQLHALFLKTHLPHDPFYATRLLRFYAINGEVRSARKECSTKVPTGVSTFGTPSFEPTLKHADLKMHFLCLLRCVELKSNGITSLMLALYVPALIVLIWMD